MPVLPDPDFALSSYAYELPEARIAQHPAAERTGSRLLCLDKTSGATAHAGFAKIGRFLPPGALLVANNSRVVPARLLGRRSGSGRMEMLLLTPPPLLRPEAEQSGPAAGFSRAEAEVLLRPAKKARPGDIIRFDDDFFLELLEKGDFGRCRVRLAWRGELPAVLARLGTLPLPPYIKRPNPQKSGPDTTDRPDKTDGTDTTNGTDTMDRPDTTDASAPLGPDAPDDAERYQTVYAREDKTGSVAAPTAGLHFTEALRADLAARGHQWEEVTLYVGYGTFSPVRCPDIREHAMHSEYVEVPEKTASAVRRARREGRAVIAVGTTSARTLEGAFAALNPEDPAHGELGAFAGWTDIFLYPGKKLHVVDGLITNFHLPESSLLMLVSALAGRENIMRAYREALERDYRFFSYGDAMLIR